MRYEYVIYFRFKQQGSKRTGDTRTFLKLSKQIDSEDAFKNVEQIILLKNPDLERVSITGFNLLSTTSLFEAGE